MIGKYTVKTRFTTKYKKLTAAVSAAVLAALLGVLATVAPASAASPTAGSAVPGAVRDGNWDGHIVNLHGPGEFTDETAEWQVPSLTCTAAEKLLGSVGLNPVGVWVGLGGVRSGQALVQTGEAAFCGLTGQNDRAWWEVVLNGTTYPPVYLPTSQYPVDTGDYVYAEVSYTGGGTGNTYTMYFADISQRWDFTMNCPSAACNYKGTAISIPNGYPATAEAIVERQTGPFAKYGLKYALPKFGTIPFSDVRYYYAGTAPAGGYKVYVVETPESKSSPPEISVSHGLLTWTASWERAH